MYICYTRTSTKHQNLSSQFDEVNEYLTKIGVDIKDPNQVRYYSDQQTGRNNNRKGLNEALSFIREGDTFIVYSVSRLARNTVGCLNIVDKIVERGANLIITSLNIDTTTPTGRTMLEMLASFSALEVNLKQEAVEAGIKSAKDRGVKFGRPSINKETKDKVVKMKRQGKPLKEIMDKTGVAKSTIYKILKEYKGEEE